MITRQFRPILTPPLRLSFRPNSSTASSLTDDLCQSVLVYRSPLRKLDTSSNQLRASFDKVCASGKLLSFSVAGTCGDCGQSTASVGCLLAHPLKIGAKIIDASKSLVPCIQCIHQALCITPLLLSVLNLKRLRPSSVVLAQGGDVLAVERGRVPTSRSKGDERSERRRRWLEPSTHSSHPLTGLTYTVYCAVLSREPQSFHPRLMRTQQGRPKRR